MFSCSEDFLTTDEDELAILGQDLAELDAYESELTERANLIVNNALVEAAMMEAEVTAKSTDGYVDKKCISDCYKKYKKCYDWVIQFRDGDYGACNSLLSDQYVVEDVICTRRVFVRYDLVVVNGEEILRPVYRTERYVCGQRTVLDWDQVDPEVRREYNECRIQAMEYFLEEYEKCMSKRALCERLCARPGGGGDGGGGQY